MRDFRRIEAWQLADDLVVKIYKLTKKFPREEMYGLRSQLRRAAASVPANIAEGSARGTQRDYLHFLYISRASLTEVDYLIHLAARLEYLTVEDSDQVRNEIKRVFGCLRGLIAAVERESGRLTKIVSALTSLAVLGFIQFSWGRPV